MEFKELIRSFGADVGIADLAPGPEGICTLNIDDMKVSFMEVPENNQLVTWATVGELPPEGRERLYRALIEAMFMGQATGGAVFSIQPNTEKLQLHRVDPLQLTDLASFKTMLENFANLLEQWRKLIVQYNAAAPKIVADEAAAVEESRQFGLGGFMQV